MAIIRLWNIILHGALQHILPSDHICKQISRKGQKIKDKCNFVEEEGKDKERGYREKRR